MIRRSVGLAAALVFALGVNIIAQAQTRHWDDNGDDASKEWSVANNWDPDGTPQPGEAIIIGFGIPTAFNDTTIVDEDFTISSLTVRGGARVDTNGNSLFVSSGAGVDLAGSVSLFVDPGGGLFTEHIFVSQAAILEVKGAAGTTDGGLVRTADLQTTSSGRAGGHGTIDLIDSGSGPAMSNGGVLFVGSRPGEIPAQRLPGTLSITGTGTLDLDGGLEDGLVDVDAMGTADGSISLTLSIEVPLADAFSGQMDIGNDDTVNIVHPWEMNSGGSLPAVLNFNGSISHTLRGGALTVNGATTQLNLNNGFTVFENDLTFNDGQFTLANGAGVRFNGTTTFTDANDFNLDVNNRIIVESVVNIGGATVAAGEDFDWDGPSGDAETEVRSAGSLNINVENVDNGGIDRFHSRIVVNSGNIDVQVADGVWTMTGRMDINNSANDVPVLSGDTVQIGDDGIIAILNVGGTGVSRISAPTLFMSDASVNVAASAILETTGPVTFQSVNGASNADFFGAGTWRLAGTNTV
ncbi:MAG TPA: hypothetical protein VHK01_07715, partial [Lacipirellulaceae bacterium]|nr:hypothetical protein [Lacipirellulaceae bacterium]